METTNLSKIRRDKMLNTISEIKKNITDEKMLTNLSMIENESLYLCNTEYTEDMENENWKLLKDSF